MRIKQQLHVRYVDLIYTPKTSYVFWPPFMTIFKEVFYDGYVTKKYIRNHTNV